MVEYILEVISCAVLLAMLLAVVCVLLSSPNLQIKDVRPHGQLGPERKNMDYVRGDELYVRFTIADFADDAEAGS